MKKTLIALALTSLTLPALAQQKAPEPDYTISGNFGLVSDYRFRGMSQSDKKPAVQGGIDFAHQSGFSLGNWNSSVSDWAAPYGSGIEMDVYGGFKKEIAGIAFDVGAIYYYYPDAKFVNTPSGLNHVNTREIFLGAGYGPVTLKISRTISERYFGLGKGGETTLHKSSTSSSKGTMYYNLTFSREIADKTTLKVHAGLLDLENRSTTTSTIKDYSIGITYDLSGWILGASYVDTSGVNTAAEKAFFKSTSGSLPDLYKGVAVLSISKSF